MVDEGVDMSHVKLVLLVNSHVCSNDKKKKIEKIVSTGLYDNPKPLMLKKITFTNYCFTNKIGTFYNIFVKGHTGCHGKQKAVSQGTKFLFVTLK